MILIPDIKNVICLNNFGVCWGGGVASECNYDSLFHHSSLRFFFKSLPKAQAEINQENAAFQLLRILSLMMCTLGYFAGLFSQALQL